MSFLTPILLFGLPLALLPVIIHLIHLLRRRQVKWAAMMFLLAAQRMNKGFSKLRQYLILAFRVLAIAALIFMISRPLAGGLLGLTGGAPDVALILLDRSASMEQQWLSTETSKRLAGLSNLKESVKKAYGKRSRLVLIDSATLSPIELENADALTDLPQSGPTDTAADVPALLQAALDYLTANQTGRTDVWVLSDLRQADWNPSGGRWAALRGAFSTLPGVRFQVLAYPEAATGNLGVTVERVERHETSDRAELMLDIRITRAESTHLEALAVPLRVVVNGVASTIPVDLRGGQVLLQAQAVPIDKLTKRGWGRVELPTDESPADNAFQFVFDEPVPLKTVIVSDVEAVAAPLQAALAAPSDPSRTYEALVLPSARVAEIPWDETALIVWHSALPGEDTAEAKQLEAHGNLGRRLLFLPTETPNENRFAGARWTSWQSANNLQAEWWRNDAGPLVGTRAGAALPVGDLEFQRWCDLEGTLTPLARLGESTGNALLLGQATPDNGSGAYFLATLPTPGYSSLARDGVVMYALLHRLLLEGSTTLGSAQQRLTASQALGTDPSAWKALGSEGAIANSELPLRAGIVTKPSEKADFLVALNRPLDEDAPLTLTKSSLDELFAGLDWRLLERNLQNEKSLASEVWRTFLMLMAAALVLEALLCMPGKRAVPATA